MSSININEDSQLPTYNNMNLLGLNKIPFIVLLIGIIIIYIILYIFLNNVSVNNESNKWWILILEIILIVILVAVISLNIRNITKNEFNFTTELKNLFNNKQTEINIRANTDEKECKKEVKEPTDHEVFHIYDNKYTYNEARDICTALDARLATYDEVETSYNKGGSWCSYGWSEDQLALFPTSKEVYNYLKKVPKHRNDCGRPGVNGGYIENSKFKFGVNCYGKKPDANTKSKYMMDHFTFTPTLSDNSFNDISNNLDDGNDVLDILIAPFSKKKWNEF